MKTRKIFYRFILFSLILIQAAAGFALKVPSKPGRRVNDYAKVFSSKEADKLERKLKQFEDATSNQVVVAVFPSLEGGNLEDFSIRLAEQWKPGQKGRDNGVIILVFMRDRKIRIEVGYGLEGALPDAVCGSIISNEMRPRFKHNLIYGGINAAADAVIAATKGEYKPKKRTHRSRKKSSVFSIVFFLLFFGFAVFANFFLPQMRRTGYGRRRSGYYHGGWGSGFGGGGFSGGGFSGGGGSFGGGGASGGW